MFKNLTVGKKNLIGFMLVLVLLTIVGGVAYYALNKASHGFTEYRGMAREANLVGRLQASMLMLQIDVKDFIKTGDAQDLKEFNDLWEKIMGFMAEAQKEIQHPQSAAKIDDIEKELNNYKVDFGNVVNYMKERNHAVYKVLDVKGSIMEKSLTQIMISAHDDNDLPAAYYAGITMKHLLLGRLYMVNYLDKNDQQSVDRVHDEFGKMRQNFEILDKELQNQNRKKLLETVMEAETIYVTTFERLVKAISGRNEIIKGSLDKIGHAIAKEVDEVKLHIKGVQDTLGPKLVASNNTSISIILIAGIVALATGIMMAIVITRSITRRLAYIIEGLDQAATQVASASGQIASASQTLAEGASEQAAGVEETSSSLEEMSSMTKQNADNAGQADVLMKQANQVVEKADISMKELTQSMNEISQASEETSKIIKTIDEIAFQTNLLALNAAVEAARAGEAGAGFAVVADEVRNLALRAAEAAKNTANLIEGTLKKVNDGSALVIKTNDAFTEVSKNSLKVGEIVGEIASASIEQAQGIEQVNAAVSEMDKVVQQNASSAEESASASEELRAQSEQLTTFVQDLDALTGRNGKSGTGNNNKNYVQLPTKNLNIKKLTISKAPKVKPEEVIPFEDDEFRDF